VKVKLFAVCCVLGLLWISLSYARSSSEVASNRSAKGTVKMNNSVSSTNQCDPYEKVFYPTLCAASSTIIAIFMAFIIAYFIYSQQKRDELSIHIHSELQNLDSMFHRYSSLREYSTRDWFPTSNHILIMEKETWDRSPSNLLDDEVRLIEEEFNRVMTKHQGLFPMSAVFNKVKFHVHGLFTKIYCELPSPPGIVRKEGPVNYFEKFVRDDFPACEIEFEKWANKFQKFRAQVINVYSRLRPTFGIMQEVREKDIERSLAMFESHKGPSEIADVGRHLRTHIEYLKGTSQYYDAFFLSLNSLGNKVREISQNIKYYRNYERNSPSLFSWSSLCIILASVFGIILPLIKLSGIRVDAWLSLPSVPLPLIVTIGFVVSTALSICLFLKSLTAITL